MLAQPLPFIEGVGTKYLRAGRVKLIRESEGIEHSENKTIMQSRLFENVI